MHFGIQGCCALPGKESWVFPWQHALVGLGPGEALGLDSEMPELADRWVQGQMGGEAVRVHTRWPTFCCLLGVLCLRAHAYMSGVRRQIAMHLKKL
jgi:hypothetical protein